MGGSVVYFDKQRGANYTKGKKRMRGDPSKGPEIKKWNGFLGTAGYAASDFVNLLIAPSGTFANYQPARISWPAAGTAQGFRVGARINFLGMRIKGWITLAPDQLKQIRWRLVLCRLDLPAGNVDFNASAYLSQYVNADTSVPTTFDVSRYESFARHNFYKKFKDVSNTSFKTKVLASGVLPPTNTYQKLNLALVGTVGSNSAYYNTRLDNVSYLIGVHAGNVGYLPIDIKVKINDSVDCNTDMRRYYIVLETDCGYGWNDEGGQTGTDPGMIVNMYARCYYTDA